MNLVPTRYECLNPRYECFEPKIRMFWTQDTNFLNPVPFVYVWTVRFGECCYRPQTKLWEGNVFTGVCLSFCLGSGGHDWRPVQTCLLEDHPSSSTGTDIKWWPLKHVWEVRMEWNVVLFGECCFVKPGWQVWQALIHWGSTDQRCAHTERQYWRFGIGQNHPLLIFVCYPTP